MGGLPFMMLLSTATRQLSPSWQRWDWPPFSLRPPRPVSLLTPLCFLQLGADLNARTNDVEDEAPGAGGRTAVTNAAMNGHTETVVKLVALGADVNARQKDGWTALHLAAKNG